MSQNVENVTVGGLYLRLCRVFDMERRLGTIRDIDAPQRIPHDQLTALDSARAEIPTGPAIVVGVIVGHLGRLTAKVVALGPFETRDAAYEWWTAPGNKFQTRPDASGNPTTDFWVFTIAVDGSPVSSDAYSEFPAGKVAFDMPSLFDLNEAEPA